MLAPNNIILKFIDALLHFFSVLVNRNRRGSNDERPGSNPTANRRFSKSFALLSISVSESLAFLERSLIFSF